jgi:hypothetical protein
MEFPGNSSAFLQTDIFLPDPLFLLLACRASAFEHGVDSPEINGWKWPERT